MKCQYCNCPDSRVLDSRSLDEGAIIRRRRECISCGKRFTTYEKIEQQPLLVIKKDQSRELFDVQKIRSGLLAACHKRPVSALEMETIINRVEQLAYNSLQEEITTKQIGELIMAQLRSLDDVAYIRFASVYRQFTDLSTFLDEMRELLDKHEG